MAKNRHREVVEAFPTGFQNAPQTILNRGGKVKGGGSSTATPIARKVFDAYFGFDQA